MALVCSLYAIGFVVDDTDAGIFRGLVQRLDKSEGSIGRLLEDAHFLMQTDRQLAPQLLVGGMLLYPQISSFWRALASTLRPWFKRFIPIDLYDQIVIPLDQEALLRLWLHVLHTIHGVHFVLSEATVRIFELLISYRMEYLPDLVHDRRSSKLRESLGSS